MSIGLGTARISITAMIRHWSWILVAAVISFASDCDRVFAQVVPRPLPPIVRPVPRPQPPPLPRPAPVLPPEIRHDVRPPVYPRPLHENDDDQERDRSTAMVLVVGLLVVLALVIWSMSTAEKSRHDEDVVFNVSPDPVKCPRCGGTGKIWQAIDGGPWESQDKCPRCRGAGRPLPSGGDSGQA